MISMLLSIAQAQKTQAKNPSYRLSTGFHSLPKLATPLLQLAPQMADDDDCTNSFERSVAALLDGAIETILDASILHTLSATRSAKPQNRIEVRWPET